MYKLALGRIKGLICTNYDLCFFISLPLRLKFFTVFCSISNRAQLAKEMHIEKLMKKNKVWHL